MSRLLYIYILGSMIVLCSPAEGGFLTNFEKSFEKSFVEPVMEDGIYGLNSADYLTSVETIKPPKSSAKKYIRRRSSFKLPDSFYFFGAPIFLLILLRIIEVFIRFFEEERKEEIKKESEKVMEPE